MQFLRLGPVGGEIPAVRTSDGAVYRLKTITTDITGGFFETDGVARTRKALGEGSLARLSDSGDGSSLRVGAPIARPTAVIRIGQNYATHARESGGEPPPVPIVFFKHPNTVAGPYDAVPVPPGSTKTDWEVELAVVIARRARHLASPAAALGYTAGTQPPTTSPSGPISLSSPAASGPRENATRRSPRWAPCSSQPTRSLTRKNLD
jgi:2,4-didehydro-3-deoxy-L-rhamnonate hydrolase